MATSIDMGHGAGLQQQEAVTLMRKKFILLFSILFVLIALSGAYIVEGTQAYMRYQQTVIAGQHYCSDQPPIHICIDAPKAIFSAFYPSYLATHYPLIAVDYSSSSTRTLFISATISSFTGTQTQTVRATSDVQQVYILPPLLANGQVLRTMTSELQTSLHIVITDSNKHTYYLNDIPLLLHSRWLMQWSWANRLQIAAWVTPNDKAVSTLVTNASQYLSLQRPPVPQAMVGYNNTTATPQQITDQVDAIYDALRGHIHYIQASVPYTGNDGSAGVTENIKLPFEVLQQQSGMCIELTTLLASAVEHIGLHAEIVIIPGHAFLGVAVKADDSRFEYWDAVDLNAGVAGDSANVAADKLYTTNLHQHTIVDTIQIQTARKADIGPMFYI